MTDKNLEQSVSKSDPYSFKREDAIPLGGLVTYAWRAFNVPKEKRDLFEGVAGVTLLTAYNAAIGLGWYLM